MTDPRTSVNGSVIGSLNRRSFLKRFAATASVLTTASVVAPRLPASALDIAAGDTTATAEDMSAAERYTVLQWTGPAEAIVQIRQLQLFGSWTPWTTAPAWTDAQQSVSSEIRHTGLVRTNGAQALQARSITPGVTALTIVRVPTSKTN